MPTLMLANSFLWGKNDGQTYLPVLNSWSCYVGYIIFWRMTMSVLVANCHISISLKFGDTEYVNVYTAKNWHTPRYKIPCMKQR